MFGAGLSLKGGKRNVAREASHRLREKGASPCNSHAPPPVGGPKDLTRTKNGGNCCFVVITKVIVHREVFSKTPFCSPSWKRGRGKEGNDWVPPLQGLKKNSKAALSIDLIVLEKEFTLGERKGGVCV